MSPSLAELQAAMADRVLGRGGDLLSAWVEAPEGTDVEARVAVYADGYPSRVVEALREVFPATAHIVGEARFSALAERYRDHVPAGWCNLNGVGRDLASFLASDELSQPFAFLPDLAKLEWAVAECFHSAQAAACDLSQCVDWSLADWRCAQIRFAPGTQVLSSSWPLVDLWNTQFQEREAIDVELVDRPDCAWIHRQRFEVRVESISVAEAVAIRGLMAEELLGPVLEQVEGLGADHEAVFECFGRWVERGQIVYCATVPAI